MIKDAKVDVVLQRIEESIGDELDVIPQKIRRYGVNNIFQRTFSYMLGWNLTGKAKKLLCTTAGVLKVADVGSGLEHVEVETGTATNVLSASSILNYIGSKVRVVAINNALLVFTSIDGITFEEPIYIEKGGDRTFDIVIKAFKTIRYGLNDADYRVEVFR